MLTRILALVGIIFLFVFFPGRQFQSAANGSQGSARPSPTPTPTPTSWPNLDKIYLRSTGAPCDLDGAAPHETEEAAANRLRNRYNLPAKFEETTLEGLGTLPQGDTSANTIIDFPTSDSPDNQRAVSVVGYVTKVLVQGCGVRSEGRAVLGIRVPSNGVESANCNTSQQRFCNTQIFLTPDRKSRGRKGRDLYVVQVTVRSRHLAKEGLLVSNIGNDWSTNTLRKKLMRRSVRFSGWLFFNPNYRERAWASDPTNKIGKANKPNSRQTAWEIHPVMGIEVMSPPPKARN